MESLNYYERLKNFKQKLDSMDEPKESELEAIENYYLFGINDSSSGFC